MIHIILLSVIVFAYLSKRNSRIQSISFVLLSLIATIRYRYGNDYDSYMHWHNWIRRGGDSPFGEEIFYTALNKMTASFYILVAITSIFFIFVIYQFITENIERKYIWLSLFVFLLNPYLFLMNLSAIRQCVAMCIYIIAVREALKGKKIHFLLLLIIAILFHKSAIILFPTLLLINEKKIDVKKVVAILSVIIVVLLFTDLPAVLEYITALFADKGYVDYIQNEMGNSLRATILSSVYLAYVLFNLPKLKGKYLVYGKLYLCGLILAVLAYKVAMLTRIQMYFDMFSIVVIPHLISRNKMTGTVKIYRRNLRKTLWGIANQYVLPVMIMMIYCLRYYSFFTNPMWSSFATYRTIFDLL